MTCFRFDIGSRAKTIGRFVGLVRAEISRAIFEEKAENGLQGDGLARRLGVTRSLLNGQLSGRKALTLRGLADLAHALDREIVFELRKTKSSPGQNIGPKTTTIDNSQVFQFGDVVRSSTTVIKAHNLEVSRDVEEEVG